MTMPLYGQQDVSMMSGGFQSRSEKVEGQNIGGERTFALGLRYGQRMPGNTGWFAEGGLELKSYRSVEGRRAPDNSTGIHLGGGYRTYFDELVAKITPYLAGMGSFRQRDEVTFGTPTYYTSVETSGLYLRGLGGFRFNLDRDVFMELETSLFSSSLWAVEKRTQRALVEGATLPSDRREVTRVELFADTTAQLADISIIFGIGF